MSTQQFETAEDTATRRVETAEDRVETTVTAKSNDVVNTEQLTKGICTCQFYKKLEKVNLK